MRSVAHEDRESTSELAAAPTHLATRERVRLACQHALARRLRVAVTAIERGGLEAAKHLIERTIRDLGGAAL
jgi:hypothetical protein